MVQLNVFASKITTYDPTIHGIATHLDTLVDEAADHARQMLGFNTAVP
jgi:hypothetical protein